MKLGGRIQASIEVLEDILNQHTPATMALRDWGKAHRFAGSKDRAAIGNYVHDALRCLSSTAYRMDDDSARAIILGTVVFRYGHAPDQLVKAFKADKHSPKALSETELKRLNKPLDLDTAPDWVKADVPEWLWPAFENNFDEAAVDEGIALTGRPPLDLRINTLKAARADILKKLSKTNADATAISPIGIRIEPNKTDQRLPNIQAEPVYQMGEIEIQDEGSQIVSQLVNAKAGDKILDFCAGGGGKSLALAAEMGGEGTIHAFDVDKRRLAPIYQRAMRAGADIIDVRQPPAASLNDLKGKMDKVLIDAPCTGVGTWRRKPDTKWRLSEKQLERRMEEQKAVLSSAKDYVRPGGLLFYVTCSMLAEENEAQIYVFLEQNEDFTILSAGEVWEDDFGYEAPKPWSSDGCSVTLTPASTKTDGFFFAVMEKQS